MLPGFRFLAAAIVVSLSVLVFGLGAAALLRAAHEQFASNASWRATPETSYTTFLPQAEPTRPVLALLRIDPAPSQPVTTEVEPRIETRVEEGVETSSKPVDAPEPAATPKAVNDVAATTNTASITTTPPPETPAAPDSEAVAPAEALKPNTMIANAAPEITEAAPEQPQAPPSIPAPVADAAPASPPPAAIVTPDPIATKLAALGEQPVVIEARASIKIASEQLHQSLEKKRQASEQAKQRLAKEKLAEARRKRHRRMLQRARAARQAALAKQQQQANDPLGQQSLATTPTLSTAR